MVTLQNSGYEQWGRPVGMDNPAAGCGGFRDGSVVSKFNLSVRVTNNRGAPIKASDWYMVMLKPDGSDAYTCFYGYTGGQAFPDIPANSARDVTFAGFVERGETVAVAFVITRDGGRSNLLTFK